MRGSDLHTCAFDELASTYDETFTDTVVGRTLRGMVWARMALAFRPGQRILELGCGTGEDAVRLAEAGVRVVATDPSARMLQVARAKAAARDCQATIEFRCAAMEDLRSLAREERFDGVFSNFGAVNCVGDLRALVTDLADRLAPGAPLLWVVMGRHVPWEWVWFLSKGSWGKAWRRLQAGGTPWRGLTISYPTPAQLSSLLRPHFAVKRLAPLGAVLPPSYAARWLDRSPRTAAMLARLESWAQHAPALAYCSDHFMIEATRSPLGRTSAPERELP